MIVRFPLPLTNDSDTTFSIHRDQEWHSAGWGLAAEAGSDILELTRLSEVTGNRTYFDMGQRATDWLIQEFGPQSRYPPLVPMQFNSDMKQAGKLDGPFTLGGQGEWNW